jgi:DNA-binding MarR family transcriptional regulator
MGLIERARESGDRRFVTTRITPAGLKLLAELDEPTLALHHRQFGGVDEAELRTLIAALERVRQRL